MMTPPSGGRRWWAAALLTTAALAGCSALAGPKPFDPAGVPPAPEYDQTRAWLAFPDHPGLEQSLPQGAEPVVVGQASADVFFIHPTTLKGSAVMNAPYDVSDAAAPLMAPVLMGQVSVFNGCCRIYAPRYRQASLAGLNDDQAMALAYADVARAFRYFIAHENRGRPFIIASHSQGTAHAVKLMQQEILHTPMQQRLVAAYLIGGYVPSNFGEQGLPTCDAARQTGCVLSYNTSEAGRSGARMLIDDKTYWWRGAIKRQGQAPALCVNPLTWRQVGTAAPEANGGSLPFPDAPYARAAVTFDALVPRLTGAVCHDGLLEVKIALSAPKGFRDKLSFLTGSYHLNDYGIFYDSLRRNVLERTQAWNAQQNAATR